MRKSFTSLVRAISPFTRKGKGSQEHAQEEEEEEALEWDLSNVDIKHALKLFYKKYNPEKAFIVNEILSKYVGDESVLLVQLCERYNLSKGDMQHFLDQAPLKHARKGSVNASPMTSHDNRHADNFEEMKRKKNGSPWDLIDVDIGQALKLIYKKHNPQKTPNISALADKSETEIVALLKQLSKRHDLDENEIQSYLNQAKRKGKHGGKLDDFDNNSVSETNVRKGSMNHSKSQAMNKRNIVEPTRGKELRQNNMPRNHGSLEMDMDVEREEPDRRGSKNNNFLEDYVEDEVEQEGDLEMSDNGMSPPPPPPNHWNDGNIDADYDEQDRLSNSNIRPNKTFESLRPKLSDGKRYTISTVINEMKNNSNNFKPFQNNNNQQANTNEESYEDENDLDINYDDIPMPKNVRSSAPTRNTSISHATKEVGTLKSELANARKHIQDMNNESRAVLHLLKNGNELKPNVATPKATVSTESKAIQVEDNTMKVEINRLKMKLQAAEDQYIQLETENNELKTNVKEFEKNTKTLQKHLKTCQADKSDLLQLINILSAAPIPAKNVLESYLGKVAGGAPKGSFLREKVFESKSQFMGDRVDALLQWKRSNEPNEDEEEEFDEDHNNVENHNKSETNENNDTENEELVDDDDMENYDVDGNRIHQKSPFQGDASPGNDNDYSMEDEEEQEENIDHTKMISPQERRIYENINIGKGKVNKIADNRQQQAANNSSMQLQIATSGGSTVSSYDDEDEGAEHLSVVEENNKKTKQEMLQDQYELAKKYYQHQQSQNKLSEQIAKGNLQLQMKENQRLKQNASTPRNGHKRTGSPSRVIDSNDNSVAASATSKPQSADETVENDAQEEAVESTSVTSAPKSKARSNNETAKNNLAATIAATSTTTTPATNNNPTPATPVFTSADWMECYDPKSQRKYYYNRVLKKSTWIKPPELVQNETPAAVVVAAAATVAAATKGNDTPDEDVAEKKNITELKKSGTNIRSASPMQARNVLAESSGSNNASTTRSSSAPPGRLRTAAAASNSSQAAPSQQRSTTPSYRGDRTNSSHLNPTVNSANSRFHNSSNGGSNTTSGTSDPASNWVMAVDPKSQRKYWYNRETKVSTWRKPVDLI